MNPAEVAALLTYASAFDGRRVSAEVATAWAEALDTATTLADARQAITAHYAETTTWVMPAHVNVRCREYRRIRAEKEAQELDRRALADARAKVGMAEETRQKLNQILGKIGKNNGE